MAVTAWAAGAPITAGRLAQMLPQYTDWTPTWTTVTGLNTPSFGNAVLACGYAQAGDFCTGILAITFGSSTNFGAAPTTADNWRFTLPVAAQGLDQAIGFVELSTAVGERTMGRLRIDTTTTMVIEISSGRVDGAGVTNNGVVDSLSPQTWGNGDTVYGPFGYRADA